MFTFLNCSTAAFLFLRPVLCPALQFLPQGVLGQCGKELGVPLVWETMRPGLLSVWWGINALTDSRATMR